MHLHLNNQISVSFQIRYILYRYDLANTSKVDTKHWPSAWSAFEEPHIQDSVLCINDMMHPVWLFLKAFNFSLLTILLRLSIGCYLQSGYQSVLILHALINSTQQVPDLQRFPTNVISKSQRDSVIRDNIFPLPNIFQSTHFYHKSVGERNKKHRDYFNTY